MRYQLSYSHHAPADRQPDESSQPRAAPPQASVSACAASSAAAESGPGSPTNTVAR